MPQYNISVLWQNETQWKFMYHDSRVKTVFYGLLECINKSVIYENKYILRTVRMYNKNG